MIGRFSKVVLPLAIIAVAVLGAVYMAKTRPRVAPQPLQERAWAVAAVPASPVDVRPEMRLFGTIVAGREVELRPLVAGRVVAVGANFVEGGVVRAGCWSPSTPSTTAPTSPSTRRGSPRPAPSLPRSAPSSPRRAISPSATGSRSS